MSSLSYSFPHWKLILIIAYLLSFVSVSNLCSQVNLQWIATYNGDANQYDQAYDVVNDKFGNIYVTGYSVGALGNSDLCTIKFSGSGVLQWVKKFNMDHNDEAVSIALDTSGNVFVAGSSNSAFYVIVKYNNDGTEQWHAQFNNGNISAISTDKMGNVYAGVTDKTGTLADYKTIKFNSTGQLLWSASYGGSANSYDYLSAIRVDSYGNVIVTGYTKEVATDDDYCTIMYNSSGSLQWVKKYNGPGNSTDGSFVLDIDGFNNVYISGYSTGSGTSSDFSTIKYDNSGNEIWVRRYDGPSSGYDGVWAIATDKNYNVYVGGVSPGISSSNDYCIVKYDSSGLEKWIARYNGPANRGDQFRDLVVDSSGNVYAAGFITNEYNNYEGSTVKFSASGSQLWEQRYTTINTGDTWIFSITLDDLNNVVVVGSTYLNATNKIDCMILKYSQLSSIQASSESISQYNLQQNYPNPFNPVTNIKFDIPKRMMVKITVFDILGKEISILANEEMNAGTYSVDWDASNYPSGVYFYKITAGDFSESRKMVLLK